MTKCCASCFERGEIQLRRGRTGGQIVGLAKILMIKAYLAGFLEHKRSETPVSIRVLIFSQGLTPGVSTFMPVAREAR